MYESIQKQKELTSKLNSQLNDLKIFLIGNPLEDTANENMKESNCLQDDINYNLASLDYALSQLEIILRAIKGGNK